MKSAFPFMIAALCASATFALAQDSTTGSAEALQPDTAVAVVDGKPVTHSELTSFSLMLDSTEMRSLEPEALLNEYVLTKLHDDLSTAGARKEARQSPTKYPGMSQRQLVKSELQKHIEESVKVPEQELENWYRANSAEYTQPMRVRAFHLFMETSADNPTSSPQAVRERLSRVKAEADKGTSFGLLAMKHSEAASGQRGGEIGLIAPNMPIGPQNRPMNPRLEQALFALEPGKVSDIVDTSHGLHLVYISEKTTTTTPSIDDLKTSGILPGAVKRDLVTSAIRTLVQETIRQENGKIAEVTAGESLTTSTPAYELGGKAYTVADLEQIYGVRFTRIFQRVKSDPSQRADLMKQAMEDEAMVVAGINKGVDKSSEIATQLGLLGERAQAQKSLGAALAEAYNVSDERIAQLYEQQKSNFLQPEAEGEILLITVKEGATPALTGRLREQAHRRAREAQEKVVGGETFEAVAEWLRSSDLPTSYVKVARHVVGETTDSLVRAFDQALATFREETGISDAIPLGSDYAIARVEKRYPGEPAPLERVRQRLMGQAQAENERDTRTALIRKLEASGKVKYLPAAAAYGKKPN